MNDKKEERKEVGRQQICYKYLLALGSFLANTIVFIRIEQRVMLWDNRRKIANNQNENEITAEWEQEERSDNHFTG